MTATDALIELTDEVRQRTLMIFDAASDAELHWTPAGLQNHILWHAGHAAWLMDALALAAITGEPALDDAWSRKFGGNGDPPGATTDWPQRTAVSELLARQPRRLSERLQALSSADLAAPARNPQLGAERTLAGWIIHALHDEAYHSGEMRLLLKMQRARR